MSLQEVLVEPPRVGGFNYVNGTTISPEFPLIITKTFFGDCEKIRQQSLYIYKNQQIIVTKKVNTYTKFFK